MAIGLLRVKGTIDIGQFWPEGSSDADTAKIIVNITPTGFKFRPHPGANFRTTNAFRDAIVIGRVRKRAIDNKGRITVRLQGIDAPELHYRPPSHLTDRGGRTPEQRERYLEVNEEYRQYLAETATFKLVKLLERDGRDPLPCTVETAVDFPDEVFDCYGRFVGDIHVSIQGADYNVNRWLVERGLAFPAFYNSMSEDEIRALRVAGDRAWAADRYVWLHLADYVGSLDWDLEYRRPSHDPVYVEADDLGDVVVPKLFRRLAKWEINRYAGMIASGFWSYVEGCGDDCYLTDEFLEQPSSAPLYGLHEFLDIDGFLRVWPEELVFRESDSRLIRPGGGEVRW